MDDEACSGYKMVCYWCTVVIRWLLLHLVVMMMGDVQLVLDYVNLMSSQTANNNKL